MNRAASSSICPRPHRLPTVAGVARLKRFIGPVLPKLAGLASLAVGAGIAAGVSFLAVSSRAAELTEVSTSLFAGSGQCAFCHDQWNRGLLTADGRDVSIGGDWRATMMAHSFRDPLWQAAVESEVTQHPQLRGLIENKCQTCHAPMARTQAAHDGTAELSLAAARRLPLAADGVSCTLCHQIQPDRLGHRESFTGRYRVGTAREIFGPYDNVFARPMQNHVQYTPRLGAHIGQSALCATCHTLFTPILGPDGQVRGEFPEQTPFLEWTNSTHAIRGRHCQDCHMPRLDEPIAISSRPPWIEPRQPFWRHQFAGANAFMLTLLKDHSRRLEAHASPAQFDAIIDQARRQLARAATVSAQGIRNGNLLTVEIEVENLAGHKFPTGHPYRRAWLHVQAQDPRGKTLFESGAPGRDGSLAERATATVAAALPSFREHLDVITRPDQVQIYEAVMADADGKPTQGLLRATRYLKDNRLPPAGFRPDGPGTEHTAIRGAAASDPNFNAAGSGRDTVTYRIPLPAGTAAEPITVTIRLLYQPVPPEAVAGLLAGRGPAAREFRSLYRQSSPAPELVHSTRLVR